MGDLSFGNGNFVYHSTEKVMALIDVSFSLGAHATMLVEISSSLSFIE